LRAVICWTLTFFIVACPLFCGADECDARARHIHETGESSCGPSTPSTCPNDAGNCVCEGAVQAVCPWAADPDSSPPLPLPDLTPALLWPTLAMTPASPAGADPSTRCGRWADALAVRALLQNFRC
jgi:hypothetical protein